MAGAGTCDWRDLVLGRMVAAEWPGTAAGELPEDPAFSAEQREAFRMDYGLAGEILELRVRRSIRPYLLAGMFIDHESHRDLPRHFVLMA